MTLISQPDPERDLVLERYIDVPCERVWSAWTVPEQIVKWFTPAPWSTVSATVDLRPGGLFHTVMRSPEGQEFPNPGCFLEVVPNQRLVFTNILAPGFRPVATPEPTPGHECDALLFTAVISMVAHGKGTKYTAHVMHADKAGRDQHAAMGFADGWGKALDQLVEFAQQG